jgi:hypothetical protein
MNHAAATLEDVGAAFAYVGQSAVEIFGAVTAAPMMAASGLDKGVKGLPLPGHEAHTKAWSDAETPPEETYTGSYGSMHRPGADRPVFARQEEQTGRGVPLRSSATSLRSVPGLPQGTPQVSDYGVQPSAARPPAWSSPTFSGSGTPLLGTAASPSPALQTKHKQPSTQPSAKIAGGTLGLPRAGFSSSYRSPTPDSAAKNAGFYGRDKTGGMSVA